MNLRTAKKHLQANILAGNATILISDPGVGKTDMMDGVCRWFLDYTRAGNPKARVGKSLFFMATQSPIGFTGLPWKGARSYIDERTGLQHDYTVTDPAIPQWYMAQDLVTGEVLPANMFDKVVLVIEEWGQGSAETKRAGAEVLRAGGTPPWYLPEGSPRIALSNHDTRDGVTKEMGFLINRANRVHIVGDAKIWHDDFADHPYQWQGRTWQMLGVSKMWGLRNPAILFEPRPDKEGPWCTARSFTAQDRYVQTVTELNDGEIPLNDPGFRETCAGYTGMSAAQSFLSMLQFALELPSYESIVKDPMGTPVPTKADLQMLLSYELAGRCERNDLANVLKFMDKRDADGKGMPKDVNITFVSTLLRRDYDLLNEPAMEAWVSRNANLVGVIGKLARN